MYSCTTALLATSPLTASLSTGRAYGLARTFVEVKGGKDLLRFTGAGGTPYLISFVYRGAHAKALSTLGAAKIVDGHKLTSYTHTPEGILC